MPAFRAVRRDSIMRRITLPHYRFTSLNCLCGIYSPSKWQEMGRQYATMGLYRFYLCRQEGPSLRRSQRAVIFRTVLYWTVTHNAHCMRFSVLPWLVQRLTGGKDPIARGSFQGHEKASQIIYQLASCQILTMHLPLFVQYAISLFCSSSVIYGTL